MFYLPRPRCSKQITITATEHQQQKITKANRLNFK